MNEEQPSAYRGGNPPMLTFRRKDGSHYERPVTEQEEALRKEIHAVITADLHALWQDFEQTVLTPVMEGYDRMQEAIAFAELHPDRVTVASCDDRDFMSALLVFVQHGTGDNFMGTTVVFLQQQGPMATFFLYPGHAASVAEAIETRFSGKMNTKAFETGLEEVLRRPSMFDAFNERWKTKPWYEEKGLRFENRSLSIQEIFSP